MTGLSTDYTFPVYVTNVVLVLGSSRLGARSCRATHCVCVFSFFEYACAFCVVLIEEESAGRIIPWLKEALRSLHRYASYIRNPVDSSILEVLMLETESSPSGLFAPSCFPVSGDESTEDEELSVLPRHTKVIVTGNNRTKSVLVGLHGVVKKAVGLGGWHWLVSYSAFNSPYSSARSTCTSFNIICSSLQESRVYKPLLLELRSECYQETPCFAQVLTNGVEVKLQRNALSVIEAPTGQEEDDDIENPFSNETTTDDFPRTFKPRVRPQKPKHDMSRTADSSQTVESKSSEFGLKPSSQYMPAVDLGKLDTAALRKYRRHFKLFDVGPNSSKEQLLRAVSRHFVGQQLDELQVIAGFVQAAKRPRM